MADAFSTYKIAVSYFLSGETKTYVGSFLGSTSEEAVQGARRFVTRFIRPAYIVSANEVVVLSGT